MRQFCRKMVSGKRIADAIRSLVNPMGLQLKCAKLLHETLLMHIHIYSMLVRQ